MTQREIIIQRLKSDGYVSRNWALHNYISRLGAIICDLTKEGWKFDADYKKNEVGKDFIYKVLNDPTTIKPEHYYQPKQPAMFKFYRYD